MFLCFASSMLAQAWILSCCLAIVIGANCNIQINGVLDALTKAIEYCRENSNLLNLDAAFGLVLGQAQLSYITKQGDILEDDLREKIVELRDMIIPVVDAVIEKLEPTSKNNLFITTVLEPEAWMGTITFKKDELVDIPDSPLDIIDDEDAFYKYLNTIPFDEPMSDHCMMSILSQGPRCCSPHMCTVTQACYWGMGLDDGQYFQPNYGATHSLLFLQMLKSQQCITDRRFHKEIDNKILQFCSYIYTEIAKNKYLGFLTPLDDILLEQITLCGFEGYMDFFSKRTITHVLKIQTPEGCFTHTEMPISSFIKDGTRRRKRYSDTLNDGCVNHTTGFGVSALSLFLRYLVNLFGQRECTYSESLT